MDDLISRQAAIDALDSCQTYLFDTRDDDTKISKEDAQYALKQLPSAQQWIPVSERLPEESGRYLISVLDGVGRRTTVAPYQPRYKAWTMTGRMAYWKVIAWLPLPEPYRGEEK